MKLLNCYYYCCYRKDEADKEVMEMLENCQIYSEKVRELSKNLNVKVEWKRISFFNHDPNHNSLSLGYVDIGTPPELSEEENSEEKYETLEMQLRQIPRRNSSMLRKNRNSVASVAIKVSMKNRVKNIIEPRKLFQNYKIVGREGHEDGEFRHPLGN